MVANTLQMLSELTAPETPQQNGVAERYNRVTTEITRCLLLESKLPKRFWVRAMATAVHLRNLCPTSSNDGKHSPHEVKFGNQPSLKSLRVFGCLAYMLKKRKGKKLDTKGARTKFIGYDEHSKAYLLWDLEASKMVRARNVLFDEDNCPDLSNDT